MQRFSSLVLLLFLSVTAGATTRRVLFIGNSFTFTNNMPAMLQALAAAQGDTLIYSESDPGGYTLQQHSTYAPTLALINAQQWDVVVLQEQSEAPAFPPGQVATDVYPYAHTLDSLIHANDACTQTMFLMTWGHANGDPANCAVYPVICTYAGMQERLRESYLQMTQDNNAIVAPVGAAWKVVRDSFPTLQLYMADSTHPVVTGSYLEACSLYGSLFHKPTLGSSYIGSVAASDAQTLQRIADKVTLDSLGQWQQYGHYPSAAFNYSVAGNAVAFTTNSGIAAGNSWGFGDGVVDTGAAVQHTYGGATNYVVSHTAGNSCFTETIAKTVNLAPAGIGNVDGGAPAVVATGSNGAVFVTATLPNTVLYVYNVEGRAVGHYVLAEGRNSLPLMAGFYLYRAVGMSEALIGVGRFVVQ